MKWREVSEPIKAAIIRALGPVIAVIVGYILSKI